MTSREQFNDYIVKQTFKYQKQYGFNLGKGKESTHNNEADAFKHAYLSAWLTIRHSNAFSSIAANFHEEETPNAPAYETNMDKWNNAIGREIGREIKEKIKGKNYYQHEIEDMIAEKIMQKMKKGELITDPQNDKRKFVPKEFIDKLFNVKNRVLHKNELTFADLEDKELEDVFWNQALDGLPTKESLDNRVARGELVYVKDYVRSDGTKVSGYYRTYPKG